MFVRVWPRLKRLDTARLSLNDAGYCDRVGRMPLRAVDFCVMVFCMAGSYTGGDCREKLARGELIEDPSPYFDYVVGVLRCLLDAASDKKTTSEALMMFRHLLEPHSFFVTSPSSSLLNFLCSVQRL